MNKCILGGRIVYDVELKITSSGKSIVTNCVAVPRKAKKDISDFINFVVWGSAAEYLNNYGKKGDRIVISGEIHQETYEDKSGNKKSKYEIITDEINLIK